MTDHHGKFSCLNACKEDLYPLVLNIKLQSSVLFCTPGKEIEPKTPGSFSKILVTLIICCTLCANHGNNEEKEDKPMLTPVQLIDLLNEEWKHRKNGVPAIEYRYKTSNLFDSKETTRKSTERKDEEALKTRKVWSRWSKWGECSVTCGSGTITRCRVCVEGRCAPGEREEQRRPCARAPCHALTDLASDDVHYLE